MIYLINIFIKILNFLTVRFEILSNIFKPKINPKTNNSMVYNNFNEKEKGSTFGGYHILKL